MKRVMIRIVALGLVHASTVRGRGRGDRRTIVTYTMSEKLMKQLNATAAGSSRHADVDHDRRGGGARKRRLFHRQAAHDGL